MPPGPYTSTDPIGLTIAADQRFSPLHPTLDAVWQLSLDAASPLSASTTFGLQVSMFSLFPRFLLDSKPCLIINEYSETPRLEKILSNYAKLSLYPSVGIQVQYELWADASTSLLGQLHVSNLNSTKATLTIQLASELKSLSSPIGMAPAARKFQNYLTGSSADLRINLTTDMANKPVLSPYPALQWTAELSPGECAAFRFRCVIAPKDEQDTNAAFAPIPENWAALAARMQRTSEADLIEIITPAADWNAVFLTCQNQAYQALVRTQDKPDALALVSQRSPDITYAQCQAAGNPLSSLTPVLDVLAFSQLAHVLLPATPNLLQQLIQDAIAAEPNPQTSPNSRTKPLPFPQLTSLCLKIFHHTNDVNFLLQVFSYLKESLLLWFTPCRDKDQDGLPEWTSAAQTGFINLPVFDPCSAAPFSTDITSTESVGLAGLLLQELSALSAIAGHIDDQTWISTALSHLEKLRAETTAFLSAASLTSFRDYQSHSSPTGSLLHKGAIHTFNNLNVDLPLPARVNFAIDSNFQFQLPQIVLITGLDHNGQPTQEEITQPELRRWPDRITLTSKKVYRSITSVSASGLSPTTLAALHVANLRFLDIGLHLVWDGLQQSDEVNKSTSHDQDKTDWLHPYGLPEWYPEENDSGSQPLINPAWNNLIIEHLLAQNARKAAAELFTRLMQGVISVLKSTHRVYSGFDSRTARPTGYGNDLMGLLSIQCFLDLIGVRFPSPKQAEISGEYPFDYPVTVRFRGMEVRRDAQAAAITFPNGETFTHSGTAPVTYGLK